MTEHLKRRKYEEDCGSMSDSCVYNTRSKDCWTSGFPPGITVDELKHYCRKKIADHPRDNLHLLEGSFKGLLSEYQRCFKNFYILGRSVDDINKENTPQYEYRGKRKVPEGLIRLEGPLDLDSEYKVSYVDYFNLGKVEGKNTMENGNKTLSSETPSDFRSQLENHRHASHWRFLNKNTNLHLEGEHFLTTEKSEKYIQFPFQPRPELAKRSTTLKLEGDMEKKTETGDKFSLIKLQERPPLYKKDTNLHLEGDLLFLTETKEKYIPTSLQSRPKLTKKNTNLKLDGDLELMPEYKQFFVEHKCQPSRKIVPVNNLTTLETGGDYDMKTEHASRFTEHQLIHPIIPHLRESEQPGKKFHLGDDDIVRKAEYRAKYVMYDKPERRTATKPKSNLTLQEGKIDTKTESKVQFVPKTIPKRERQRSTGNISLEGDIDMNPEYKNAYVDFYASSAKSLPLPERRKPPQSHLNEDIKIENGVNLKPEYRSSYVDFPRQRPSVKKPETHLSPEGNLLLQTEKREKYVPYSNVPRVALIRRKPELSLEGPFECQPEYRRAYQAYLMRENLERKQRPFDNMSVLQPAEKVPSARKSENLQVPAPPSDKDKQDTVTTPLKTEAQTPVSISIGNNNKSALKPNSNKPSKETTTNKKSVAPKSSQQQQSETRNRNVTRRQTSPRKFDKFIEVPNLAYKDPYSPISSLIHTPATTTPRCLSPVNLPPRFLSPQTQSSVKTTPARRGKFSGRNLSQKSVSTKRPVSKSVSPRRPMSLGVSSRVSSSNQFSSGISSPQKVLLSPRSFSPGRLTPRNTSPKFLGSRKASSRCLTPRNVSPKCLNPRNTSPTCVSPKNVSAELLSHNRKVSSGVLTPRGVSCGWHTSRVVSPGRLTPRVVSPGHLSPRRASPRCLTPRGASPRRMSLKSVSPRRVSPKIMSSKDLWVSRGGSPRFLSSKEDSPRFISSDCISPTPKTVPLKKCVSRRNSYERFDLNSDEFVKGDCGSKDQTRVSGNEKSFIVIKDDLNNNDVNGLYDGNKNHEINSYDDENLLTSWDSGST